MAQHVQMNERSTMKINSLELTGYRFEIIAPKREPILQQQLKKEQERTFRMQDQMAMVKGYKNVDLDVRAILAGDDRRASNRNQSNQIVADRDYRRLQKTLVQSRRDALQKLFCDDYKTYESELQSLGKSMYKHYH